MANGGGTHTVMPKKLAQALMEAGMKHFDAGGEFPIFGDPGRDGTDGPLVQQDPTVPNSPLVPQPQPHAPAAPSSASMNGVPIGGPGAYGQDVGGSRAIQGIGAPNIYMQPNLPYQLQNAWDNSQVTGANQRMMSQDLQNQAMGIGGPAPEQTMLNQQTGINTANQAALMAGQRGASSNPALMAKMIAQQGAMNQQGAVGQGATMAQQRMMGAQNQRMQLEQAQAQNYLQSQNIMQGAVASQNRDITSGVLGAEGIQNAQNMQNNNMQNQLMGGLLSGIAAGGTYAAFAAANKGGKVPRSKGYDLGGIVRYDAAGDPSGPSQPSDSGTNPLSSIMGGVQGAANLKGLMGSGGGGGSSNGQFSDTSSYAATADQFDGGGKIPGKSEVSGNSPTNDKVPALLSPGEVVIDKETLNDKGAIGKAARMVADHIAQRNKTNGDSMTKDGTKKAGEFMKHLKTEKKGYGGVISSRACGGKV